ncbi:aspartate carbamoyltransferase [Streptomyces griseoflavus]|uniref:aspartate/ornithine carbamoyltransferase family protein n=1 Tax=Streptomyces griseoflavus TaxID=35619 RepID=UPI003802056F
MTTTPTRTAPHPHLSPRPGRDPWHRADVLSMRQYGREDLQDLFHHTDTIRASTTARTRLAGRVLVSAFYQSSTRTRLAHEAAMLRMGGTCTGFADAGVTRAGDFFGESPEDIARMLGGYGDVVVVRHPQTGAPRRFASTAGVPVINAGDGWGEHPTQAMTDLYTMRRFRGGLDGATIVLTGDLRMRTMRSVLLALRHYDCRLLLFPGPGMTPDPVLIDEVSAGAARVERAASLAAAVRDADFVYMEPVVQPDYTVGRSAAPAHKPATPDAFRVDRALLENHAGPHLRVLHSLPRQDELCTDLDDTSFNGYWAEARNGVPVRMALLDLMLGA